MHKAHMVVWRWSLWMMAAWVGPGCVGGYTPEVDEGSANGVTASNSAPGVQDGSGMAGDGDGAAAVYPFEAPSRASALHKIKVTLLGQRATDAELQTGTTDEGLGQLVDAWMQDPAYDATMLHFFSWATQQTQPGGPNLDTQFDSGIVSPTLMAQVREQFGRTAAWMAKNDTPFNQIASTQTFMVTPRLLAAYSYAETRRTYDDESVHDVIYTNSNNKGFTLQTHPAIPLSQTIDPKSSNYLVLSVPTLTSPDCASQLTDPYVQTSKGLYQPVCSVFYENLVNALDQTAQVIYDSNNPGGKVCHINLPGLASILPADQADVWRPVTLKRPSPGQNPNLFWDADALLHADTFLLSTPRIGFWSTLSFFTQWTTNVNNQARTTVNQALIAGLGKAFDGSDATMPISTALIPPEHAAPNSPCYGCHLTMDPMRQIFRQNYTTHYDPQQNPNLVAVNGFWAQNGVSQEVTDIAQFGALMAASPVFAIGWAKKVCSWINSAPCDVNDPTLKQIAADFAAGGFKFNRLFKALLVSPITTFQSSTTTATRRGTTMTMARRDQLCQVLSNRLSIDDFCMLSPLTQASSNRKSINTMVSYYPADAYSRNAVEPVMVTQPTMPVRMGLETLCGYASLEVVGSGSSSLFSSSNPNMAVDAIATRLMALNPNEKMAVGPVLMGHYRDSVAAGTDALTALRSTFVLGCMSPYVATIGLDG